MNQSGRVGPLRSTVRASEIHRGMSVSATVGNPGLPRPASRSDARAAGRAAGEPGPAEEFGPRLSDGELLDLCRSGDAHSWGVLVDRYARLVTSVAVRAGLPIEEAKDVTQSTFVALLESGTRIRDTARVSGWLVTVAQRQAWMVRRRLERELLVVDDLPDAFDDPREAWENLADLQAALHSLGGPCRDLLEALYLDPSGPSYADVASRLGRAVGTIGPTRARCLNKLRDLLGDGL